MSWAAVPTCHQPLGALFLNSSTATRGLAPFSDAAARTALPAKTKTLTRNRTRTDRMVTSGIEAESLAPQNVGAGLVPARASRKCDRREAGGREARPYGTGDDRGSRSFQRVGAGLVPARASRKCERRE